MEGAPQENYVNEIREERRKCIPSELSRRRVILVYYEKIKSGKFSFRTALHHVFPVSRRTVDTK